jgi:hypothetical protein
MTVGKKSKSFQNHRKKITKKGNFNYVSRSGDRGNFIFLMLKNPKNSEKILKIIETIPTVLEALQNAKQH